MRKSRFNEETDHCHPEGIRRWSSIPAIFCCWHGITRASLYRWKAKYGGMQVSEGAAVAGSGRGEPAAVADGGGPQVLQAGVAG